MDSLPPRSSDHAIVQAIRFGADPYGYLAECAREVGDPFTLLLPGDPPRVVFSDPALVRQTFALRPDEYELRGAAFPLNIGENALLFLDGERHRRERAVMMPPLHGERLRSYASTMASTTCEALGRWRHHERIELQPALQEITLEVLLRCVFGFADRDRLRQPVIEWLEGTLTPLVFFSGMFLGLSRVRVLLDRMVARAGARAARPRPGGAAALLEAVEGIAADAIPVARAARAKAEIIRVLSLDVERCRKDGAGDRSDILALLAQSTYEDGSPLAVENVVDELVTLLVGGHETTSNSMAWVLSHVLARPRVVAEITDELERVFGGGPVEPDRTSELVYLDACIKEGMRLSPIAPAVPRPLAKPLEFAGYRLPAGTILWPSVVLTHRRADVWPDPMEYRPERFLGTTAPTNLFYPFGGGRRTCLGMAFATLEMRIVLAEMFSRLTFELAPGARAEPAFRGVTVAPAGGLAIEITGRVRRPMKSGVIPVDSLS